jgi:transposase
MGGWATQCHGAMAAPQEAGVSGLSSGRLRVGDAPSASGKADNALSRAPSARTVARLMTMGCDVLSKAEAVTVAAIEGGVPLLVEAREIVAAFQAMVRKKTLADLEPWLAQARSSLVASFANGVIKDRAAVSAAIISPWSNGQTEGQITKLKLVKRQMYGRGKLDLLQARVIGPA